MKKYLEFISATSSKFWEVTVNGNEVTTRYGKIGATGRSKTTTFADATAAIKKAEKEVKAKLNKGYKELSLGNKPPASVGSPKVKDTSFELVPIKEIEEKYNIWNKINGSFDAPNIQYYSGDAVLAELSMDDGDIDVIDGIIVAGDLTIRGNLLNSDSAPFLFVNGNLQVKNAILGDAEIWVEGNMTAENAIFMSYNHGMVTVKGNVAAKAVICDDHHFECDGTISGVTISDGSFDSDFKMFEGVISNHLLKENGRLDWGKLETAILAGKPYYKKSAKPPRVVVQKMVEKLAKKGEKVTQLDLSDKDLKELPELLFDLTDLEELNLEQNSLKSIPAAIGQLRNLRVLKLGYVSQLAPLPDSFYDLKNLEELEIHSYYHPFSEKIGQLNKLKIFRCFYSGQELPAAFNQLQNLEKLELAGSSNKEARLTNFPSVVGDLRQLKELILTGHAFKTIPAVLSKLQNLEKLKLSKSIGYISCFPDISMLTKLKIVHLNGGRNATYDPYPSHDLLIDILKKLPLSIEVLGIDRWGKNKNFDSKQSKQVVVRSSLKTLPATIGQFKNLRSIELDFNDLETFPDSFFELKKLEKINLNYNEKLTEDTINQLVTTFPDTKIIFGNLKNVNLNQHVSGTRVHKLSKAGGELMGKRKWEEAIKVFKEAIALCKEGKIYSEYDYLYIHYGVSYSLNLAEHNSTDSKEKAAYLPRLLAAAKAALELCPASIWHFTPLGKFQAEVIRTAGNALGWKIYESETDEEKLEEGLVYASRAAEHIIGSQHYFIYDTKVRLLLKLKRTEAAYQIVERVLSHQSSFGDFQDIKKSAAYKKWLRNS